MSNSFFDMWQINFLIPIGLSLIVFSRLFYRYISKSINHEDGIRYRNIFFIFTSSCVFFLGLLSLTTAAMYTWNIYSKENSTAIVTNHAVDNKERPPLTDNTDTENKAHSSENSKPNDIGQTLGLIFAALGIVITLVTTIVISVSRSVIDDIRITEERFAKNTKIFQKDLAEIKRVTTEYSQVVPKVNKAEHILQLTILLFRLRYENDEEIARHTMNGPKDSNYLLLRIRLTDLYTSLFEFKLAYFLKYYDFIHENMDAFLPVVLDQEKRLIKQISDYLAFLSQEESAGSELSKKVIQYAQNFNCLLSRI